MDNREAVNWLINISADIGKAEHSDLWHYEQALTEIKDMLESAQPEQRWIPVSERLPEEGGEYLTYVYHIVGPISVFHPEDDTYVSDVAIMKFYDKFPSTVRAWMPLPEPYKEGDADVQ